MSVRLVVPGEEPVTETPRVLQRAKASGEVRPVLQGLELAFRKRVVVGDVRPAEALGHPEIGRPRRVC
jgi:hypothetical protein